MSRMIQGMQENVGVVVVKHPRPNVQLNGFVIFNFLLDFLVIGLGMFLDEPILIILGLIAILCFIGILDEFVHLKITTETK